MIYSFFWFLGSKIFSILSFTAIPFVVCPSLLPYLLIPKYCWHALWFFSTFFSCSSFLLLSFFSLPHLVMPFCLLPPFIIIDIPVTLDLFCKDHKAVRPLSRWKPKQNWLWRWSNEKGLLLGSVFCLWSLEEGCLVLSLGCIGEPARSYCLTFFFPTWWAEIFTFMCWMRGTVAVCPLERGNGSNNKRRLVCSDTLSQDICLGKRTLCQMECGAQSLDYLFFDKHVSFIILTR